MEKRKEKNINCKKQGKGEKKQNERKEMIPISSTTREKQVILVHHRQLHFPFLIQFILLLIKLHII